MSHRIVIDLFGEPVELRASPLPSAGVPVSCFLATGEAVADIALIRPFDGLVEYDDARMLAAIEGVRRRRSTGFRVFFLAMKPVLLLIDILLALLRGVGRMFGALSILGIFSLVLGLIAVAAMVATLGAMAAVLLYALPVLALAYGVKAAYKAGNRDALNAMKAGCTRLGNMVIGGDTAIDDVPDAGIVIEAVAEPVTTQPPLPALAAPANPHRSRMAGQLAKGLAIGLALGVPGAATVLFGPKTIDGVQSHMASKPAEAVRAAPPIRTPANLARSGPAEIVDTATLTVAGQRIRLSGLVPVTHPAAEAAARAYLALTGDVRCESVPAGGWRCLTQNKGLDVAEVFALSGFAKAAVDAPVFLRNAEAIARQNRRGVWGAS